MGMDPSDIVTLYEQRKLKLGGTIGRMLNTQRMYDNEIMVPLPELDKNERPAVANLLIQGVDQLGMRLSSRLPDVQFPSAKPGDKESDKVADDARSAVLGWWDMNQLQKKFARRARFLVAYGCAPAMVKPVGTGYNSQRKMPYWHVLNPLSVFPNISGDPDDIEPHDVIVARQQSLAWLQKTYPAQAAVLAKGPKPTPDKLFELLEYNDEFETVLVCRGHVRQAREYMDPANGTAPVVLLERTTNTAGLCLAVVPGRITLSKLSGHFDQIIGMFLAQAKLSAYELIAIRKGIFPELWAVTHPGSPGTARIITVADGREGIIGEVENGTLMPINPQPGVQTTQAIDRLERNQRVQGSIPSDWGGESASNIRTAKRGEQVSSSASDPTLAELQIILAEAMQAEDVRGIALAKSLWGPKQCSFYMSRSGRNVSDDYKPNVAFAQDFHWVKFSLPGVDAAGIPIELGQRTGTHEMSMYTARRVDPMVENPDFEDRQVDVEQLRTGLLAGLSTQLEQGMIDPHEIAIIAQKLTEGQELEDAVAEAHKEIQASQAAAAQSQPPPTEPEGQPGLGQTPQGGGTGAAPAGGPPPLAQLLAGLRQPAQQGAAEQQLSPPAPGAK